MNSFFGFIRKEFYHILRDRRTVLILFGMPILQMLIFGFAIRNEVNNAPIAILDLSHDRVTQELTNKLLSSGYFISADRINSEKEIEAAFQNGTIKMAIVFEPQLGERLFKNGQAKIQLLVDATEPNIGVTLSSYASAIISDYQSQISTGQVWRIIPETQMRFNPEMKSVFLFVPGLIGLLLMLISALMTSIAITREKELGTMEVLLVSPLKPVMIIIGKVVPYLMLSFVNITTILILARYVFDVPFRGNYGLFFFEAFLFVIVALSLGILISIISATQQTAMMISLAGLMLPVIILSGFIFPITSMPLPLQVISNIIPAKWFLIIVRGIMLKGVGLEVLWPETLVLSCMAAILITLSIKKFKIRLG